MQPAWPYVAISLVDGQIEILETGAEIQGSYRNPGPSARQGEWAKNLANEFDLPNGSEIHIFRPPNRTGMAECSFGSYRVVRPSMARVERIIRKDRH